MLNDLAVYVYEPFVEWTEQVTKWGATIVSTPEEASVIVCDAKPKERLPNKPKILYPTVLERMVSHGTDFTGMDLSKTALKQGYLCVLNFTDANFTSVNLSNTTFEGSNCRCELHQGRIEPRQFSALQSHRHHRGENKFQSMPV